jgi:Acetyltransferase (GNAT) domain
MRSPRLRTEVLTDASGFVRYWRHIEQLLANAGAELDVQLNPLHFLATTDDTRRSCSVACWQGEILVGLMYATERYLRGMRTGYAIGGDYSGRGLLLCSPERENEVITACMKQLVSNGIHSLHLRLVPRDQGDFSVAGMKIKCLEGMIPGDRMPLPASYEEFLGTLGKHTRRNVRNFTRKTQQAGITFSGSLTKEEYQSAVERLNAHAVFRADPLRLARDERLLSLHSGAQRFGLCSADGTPVAVLCGFTQDTRFHLLTQLNDVQLEHLSLSLVLRGQTVEHLIASGHSDLQFMGGTSLSFGRFCPPQRYRSLFADKRIGIATAVKRVMGKAVNLTERMGNPAPEALKLFCNGKLDEDKLIVRTALGPAAVAFAREQAT